MTFEEECFNKACFLIERDIAYKGTDVFELTDLLIKLELEKKLKNSISDSLLDFNDDIVLIEDVGEKETIDISVSGDNLFYCNGILTKNSFGLPATVDFMFALISTEELEQLNQIMVKQLKNRYSDPNYYKKFVVGIDRSKMKLYNVESSAQKNISDSGNSKKPSAFPQANDVPVFDSSSFSKRQSPSAFDFDFQ